MTPAQQSALEAVAGRALAGDELAALGPLVDVRNDAAIAAALSVGRTRIESTFVGVGRVMDCLGPVEGAAVLDALDALRATVSPVKWAWLLLERGELDVGLASVRGQIDALVPDVMTADQAQVLKDLAMRPDPIPLNVVSEALNA